MKLKANVMVIAGEKTYSPGETFTINDDEGQSLVERKLASRVERPDPKTKPDARAEAKAKAEAAENDGKGDAKADPSAGKGN
ncbi:MAG: hypothetical protein GY832_30065 [Chloroflexi bacterium]|nr:hypothetical protein [Chloroflexota bacterium]